MGYIVVGYMIQVIEGQSQSGMADFALTATITPRTAIYF